MNKNISKKKYYSISFILVFLFLFISVFYSSRNLVCSSSNTFKTIEGPVSKNSEINVRNSHGIYNLNMSDKKFPREVSWTWTGKGQVWASVQYSDKNVIYYLIENSEVPQVDNITFIDFNGVPRIIVPKILKIPKGNVKLDFINAYNKYYGAKKVNVEKVSFQINGNSSANIKNFKVLKYDNETNDIEENGTELNEQEKKLHVEVQIPQGNNKDFYMLKNKVLPIEVSVRALLDKDTNGYLNIVVPQCMKIDSYDKDKLQLMDNHTLKLSINAVKGYYEEKIIIMASIKDSGLFQVKAVLGDETKKISKNIHSISLDEIKSKIYFSEEGVYPVENDKHETIMKKELKNNIRLKQNVSDLLHRFIGSEEEYDSPAGLAYGVIKNNSKFDIPLHVKFAVLDDKENEITYFRGEDLQKDEELKTVPETNMVINSKGNSEIKMPIFADIYSVKAGKYKGQMQISFFGSNCKIFTRQFDLYVNKESQLQGIIGITAVALSIFCMVLICVKNKKWIRNLKTSEVMFIALFSTVKFALVDITYFVMGDVLRGILGPLGPFMHIITGIFWDLINSLFLVTMIALVPKPGVIIISTIVRLILKGVAFGDFNPVSILLMLSYAAIAEGMLYLSGFINGKRKLNTNFKVFITLGVVFGIQNCYSTYTFYYIWMYLYRLFYPDWYINISAIFSVIYSILGSIGGVYLGKKLKKVID